MPENVNYLRYLTVGVARHTQKPYPAMTSLGLCSSLLSYWEITGHVNHILELCASHLLCSDFSNHYQTKYRTHCTCANWVASSHCCVARIVFEFSVTQPGAALLSQAEIILCSCTFCILYCGNWGFSYSRSCRCTNCTSLTWLQPCRKCIDWGQLCQRLFPFPSQIATYFNIIRPVSIYFIISFLPSDWDLISYQSLKSAILGPPALRDSDKVLNTKCFSCCGFWTSFL